MCSGFILSFLSFSLLCLCWMRDEEQRALHTCGYCMYDGMIDSIGQAGLGK
jgi:hypothetical protein